MLVGPAPELAQCDAAGDSADIRRYEPGVVELDANLACKGILVMSETWYPGWKAAVDGGHARIHEVDGAIRGVVVDAGPHKIVLTYRPMSVYLGGAMSLFATVIAGYLLWRIRKTVFE